MCDRRVGGGIKGRMGELVAQATILAHAQIVEVKHPVVGIGRRLNALRHWTTLAFLPSPISADGWQDCDVPEGYSVTPRHCLLSCLLCP